MKATTKSLVELVAMVAAEMTGADYRPTITDPEQAAAFDAAMILIGHPARAWRGSKAEARRGATMAQLEYRAQRFGVRT